MKNDEYVDVATINQLSPEEKMAFRNAIQFIGCTLSAGVEYYLCGHRDFKFNDGILAFDCMVLNSIYWRPGGCRADDLRELSLEDVKKFINLAGFMTN